MHFKTKAILVGLVLALQGVATSTYSQGLNFMRCAIVFNENDNVANIQAVAVVKNPAQVEYNLSVVHLSASGLNTSTQSGIADIDSSDPYLLSRVSVRVDASTLIEATLELRESQSGYKCESANTLEGSSRI